MGALDHNPYCDAGSGKLLCLGALTEPERCCLKAAEVANRILRKLTTEEGEAWRKGCHSGPEAASLVSDSLGTVLFRAQAAQPPLFQSYFRLSHVGNEARAPRTSQLTALRPNRHGGSGKKLIVARLRHAGLATFVVSRQPRTRAKAAAEPQA